MHPLFSGVQAIVVGGSVARGYADAYSDLELSIFWDELPTDATRLALVDALHGEFLYGYDGPAWEDQLLIDGFQVDLWHNTVAEEEAVFKAVLKDYSTDFGDSNFMDTIRACIPLYGEAIIEQWKRQAAHYPEAAGPKEHRAAPQRVQRCTTAFAGTITRRSDFLTTPVRFGFMKTWRMVSPRFLVVRHHLCPHRGPVVEPFRIRQGKVDAAVAHRRAEVIVPVRAVDAVAFVEIHRMWNIGQIVTWP